MIILQREKSIELPIMKYEVSVWFASQWIHRRQCFCLIRLTLVSRTAERNQTLLPAGFLLYIHLLCISHLPAATDAKCKMLQIDLSRPCLSFAFQSSRDLICFLQLDNVNIYYGSDFKSKHKAPTDFCFVLKVKKKELYIYKKFQISNLDFLDDLVSSGTSEGSMSLN